MVGRPTKVVDDSAQWKQEVERLQTSHRVMRKEASPVSLGLKPCS